MDAAGNAGSQAPPLSRPIPERAPWDVVELKQAVRGLGRWVYTNNPFYVLSAILFFWGLWGSCYVKDYWAFKTVTFMVGLAAYTLLLAATTLLVVRWGKVWEDGRSLLVLIVLMLLGMSVSFDEALTGHFRVGALCAATGLAFAGIVSEVVLLGLGLRLGSCLRVPYYLILGLFFGYPVVLGAMDQQSPTVPWMVFAFPGAAGLVALSLIPAIHRGPAYVRDNGSPWPWPWFPWTLFVLLGLAVGPRTYYLSVSMHQVGGVAAIFAPYFLVPLVLTTGVLLLEIGLVARSASVVRWTLALPLVALAMTSVPCRNEDVPLAFLAEFREVLQGTPLYFTLALAAAFYLYAAVRRAALALDALTATLVLLAFVGRDTYGLETLSRTQPVPLLVAAALQAVLAYRQRTSGRCFTTACVLIAAATAAWRGTWFTAWDGFLTRHLLLAAMLLAGAGFRDRFARVLEHLAAIGILVYGVTAALGFWWCVGRVPDAMMTAYPALAIVAAVVCGWLLRNRYYYAVAAITGACWALGASGRAYLGLQRTLRGLPYLVAALAVFVFALLVSLFKARARRPLHDHRP